MSRFIHQEGPWSSRATWTNYSYIPSTTARRRALSRSPSDVRKRAKGRDRHVQGTTRLHGGSSGRGRQQADPEGIAEFVKRELPFGRFGRPDEIGAVVTFLASPRASWVSGASIVVDGGQSRSNI